jgi:hypothetical protein
MTWAFLQQQRARRAYLAVRRRAQRLVVKTTAERVRESEVLAVKLKIFVAAVFSDTHSAFGWLKASNVFGFVIRFTERPRISSAEYTEKLAPTTSWRNTRADIISE